MSQAGSAPQIDANVVIKYLRQRLNEVEFQNAVLLAQIETKSVPFVDIPVTSPDKKTTRRRKN